MPRVAENLNPALDSPLRRNGATKFDMYTVCNVAAETFPRADGRVFPRYRQAGAMVGRRREADWAGEGLKVRARYQILEMGKLENRLEGGWGGEGWIDRVAGG